ncbi:IS110 family transposase [Trueperella pecoris]|uniref:IS110 family transposase n=1 Tax=Trueperella pecoris TaxID=2733571 RepID=A0A7M1QYA1_9ACTO|nr:IS110 family transposase [Trueperella pecoris]QOR47020.1 IS110 family transposase [Trueperella pecoris]
MSIVADVHPYVVGVDTHARHHVYSVLASLTGELLGSKKFPTTEAGMKRAMSWVLKNTRSHEETLWVIEGTSSYGAILTGMVLANNLSVAEAPRVDSQHRYGSGKTDELDSSRIARAALGLPVDKLRRPRLGSGVRQAIRILITSRELLAGQRTRSVNALTALVRSNPLGVDARCTLSSTQIKHIASWRMRGEDIEIQVARAEAKRLARQILELDCELENNERELAGLVQISEAAPLLQEKGFGVVSAAKCLVAWSHYGRVKTEAEFASLAGVNPIPASSGNTVRHRLNRGGDRKLNSALHMVAIVKMTHDEETKKYVAKRQKEGKTNREIRRCLKRYIARRVYRTLNSQHTLLIPA